MNWTINKINIYCDKEQGNKKRKINTWNIKLFFVIQRNCWCFDMNILGHCDLPQQCIHSLCFLMVYWSCLKWMIIRIKQTFDCTGSGNNINIILVTNDCPIILFYFSALVIMVNTYPFVFEACLFCSIWCQSGWCEFLWLGKFIW